MESAGEGDDQTHILEATEALAADDFDTFQRILCEKMSLEPKRKRRKKRREGVPVTESVAESVAESVTEPVAQLAERSFLAKVEFVRMVNKNVKKSDVKSDKNKDMALELLKKQKEKKGKINDPTNFWIHYMVEKRLSKYLQVLKTELDVDGQNEKGETPLFVAVKSGWSKGVAILLRPGTAEQADIKLVIDKKNHPSQTVLQLCVSLKDAAERSEDDLNIFKTLVQTAASKGWLEVLDQRDDKQRSLLANAVRNKKRRHVKVLLEAKANVTLIDVDGNNVLHLAAKTGDLEVMRELYPTADSPEMKKIVEMANTKKQTPLIIGICLGHVQIVKYLLEDCKVAVDKKYTLEKQDSNQGKDKKSIDETKEQGIKSQDVSINRDCTILHLASLTPEPNREVLEYFTDSLYKSERLKKLVNYPTSEGYTPLYFAVIKQQIEFIYALLAAGADLTARCNKSSRTIMDIFINEMPSSVDVLSKVLDRAITKPSKKKSVVVDYNVFLPRRNFKNVSVTISPYDTANCEGSMANFQVFNELEKLGNRLGQWKILEHPLVESFLYLHWKIVKVPYFTLVTLHALFAFLLCLLVLCKLLESDKVFLITGVLLLVMALLVLHEIQCINKSRPLSHWVEVLLKFLCFFLTIANIFPETPADLSAFAVLLSLFELLLLISRIPHYGYYMQLFIEVGRKYLLLLFSFFFIILGFALAFMVTFRGTHLFDPHVTSVIKTMVMFSNEYDYGEISKTLFSSTTSGIGSAHTPSCNDTSSDSSNLSTLAQFSAIVIFILFFVCIGLILSNLFVGVAVFHTEKLRVVSKQIEFLGLYGEFLFGKPWLYFSNGIMCFPLLLFCGGESLPSFSDILKKSSYEISSLVGESTTEFPEELNCSLTVKAYENRERISQLFREREMKRQAEWLEEKKLKDELLLNKVRKDQDFERKETKALLAAMKKSISELSAEVKSLKSSGLTQD